jgi:transcriptional regulator GlxA family with amidase domain
VSEQFVFDRVRDDKARLGFNHKALSEAAALMEGNIEEPLSLEDLAGKVSLSPRQLQRMFRHSLSLTPTQYYLNLRLQRARELLLQTSMSIMDVTLACGFQSPCHFSKSYRTLFGHSPSAERRQDQSQQARRAGSVSSVRSSATADG